MFHHFFFSSSATRNLFLYNLFLSLSLTIVSNFLFIDRLLLRLKIDLSLFGSIKSLMFLLPALLYQFLLPLFRKLDRDVEVCAVSYALRCFFPLCLPFCAVFFPSSWMTGACFLLLPLGMMFAVFANNSLMKLYREVLYPAKYNYYTGFMNMFLCLPALVLSLPLSWLLDRYNGLCDRDFFLLFGFLELFTFCFEIPAILALRKVKKIFHGKQRKEKTLPEAEKNPHARWLEPYREPRYCSVLGLVVLHRIAAGLMMAYLTVYFLEVMHFSMTVLAVIGLVMSPLVNLSLPFNGKMMDRFGYEKVFLVLSGGLLLGMVLFCLCWKSLFVLPLFILLTWDGLASLFGGLLYQGEYSASGKLADPSWLDAAVASYSICNNGGYFLGLIASSCLYALVGRFCGEDLSSRLHWYFLLSLPVFCLLFLISLFLFRLSRRKRA